MSKRFLARQICQWMDWRAQSGRAKEAACLKTLGVVNKQIVIDIGQQSKAICNPQRKVEAQQTVAVQVADIACDLSGRGGIELEMVTSRYSKASKIWNTVMDEHHYLGSGPLCGAQLRYLVLRTIYGYLGAVSFNSAAWALKDRDKWYGGERNFALSTAQRLAANSL